MTDYELVIGLEVHVELKTKSKIFCGCSTAFGGEPNAHTCPGCLGLPGALPVFNEKVLEYAIRAGLALDCEIAEHCMFDRKNYFYPDLPTAYQITQFAEPICGPGRLTIEPEEGNKKTIGVTRIHIEEDAGKLNHLGATITSADASLVDYNRAGVPLLEIVSEPDMRSAAEARLYMEELHAVLSYLDISDVKMEQGSMRCDANVSVRRRGEKEFGVRTETKNLNSFRAVEQAIEYERERQIEAIEAGEAIVQQTRTWDEAKGITLPLRTKEEADDYRYFPDPDLGPYQIDGKWVEELGSLIPELPAARRERYQAEYGLSAYDAAVLTGERAVADFFEAALDDTVDPKKICNWITGELLGYLNAEEKEISEVELRPEHLGELIKLIDEGTVSGKIGKQIFPQMVAEGKSPALIVKEENLVQISDEGALNELIDKVVTAAPQSVADYKAGKKKALGYFVGQIMKETKGQANPAVVNRLLKEKLDSIQD